MSATRNTSAPVHKFSPELENILEDIENMLDAAIPEEQKRFYAIKLFERDDKIAQTMKVVPKVEDIIKKAENALDDDSESIITNERYGYITSVIGKSYKEISQRTAFYI